MGLFTIDIEKFYEELKERGEVVKGMFCIQYPIYCIHSSIIDITADPLDNLDKAIVDFIVAKNDFSSFQIASLMGTSKALIEKRINKLLKDDLLEDENDQYLLSSLGVKVFREKSQIRKHKHSYDFYLDGISLQPLSRVFYSYYTSRFISEHDSYYYTDFRGEARVARPFGPDLVHTPPDKNVIVDNIFGIEENDRSLFAIPGGLSAIDDISFTKLSLQLLVSVSSSQSGIKKQIIDGFAIYSLSDNLSYYEALRRNILSFENSIKEKIENLEFKISVPFLRADVREQPKPILTSNWQEIDRYSLSREKCFSFSSEDLLKVIAELFLISHVGNESIVNEDAELVVSISKEMLLTYPDRNKLVSSLIRQRLYYKPSNLENNVFLLYLYFTSSDEFVNKVISFKKRLTNLPVVLSREWIHESCPEFGDEFRQLLIASGEYDILEKMDMNEHMINVN